MRCQRGYPSERRACTTAGGASGAFKRDDVRDEQCDGAASPPLNSSSSPGTGGREPKNGDTTVLRGFLVALCGLRLRPVLG
eukprot:387204-Rhodomonas_salina.1